MKLTEKLFPLHPDMVKIIEKQLKKSSIVPKKNWYKKFLVSLESTENADTLCIMFSRNTKKFYCSCSLLNSKDEYDCFVGEIIAFNRIALSTDFQREVGQNNITGLLTINVDCA